MRFGISLDQDTRFKDKSKTLLKTMNFPKILNEKVDFSKINLDVMRPWIAKRVTEILGFEDEICIEFVNTLLQDEPDPKQIQLKLTGFLEESTFGFMKELWGLLLSAQKTVGGIPREFLEEAKKEMLQARNRDQLIQQELKKIREKDGPREKSPKRETYRRSRSRHRYSSRSKSRDRSRQRYSRRQSRSRSRSRDRYSRDYSRYERRSDYRDRDRDYRDYDRSIERHYSDRERRRERNHDSDDDRSIERQYRERERRREEKDRSRDYDHSRERYYRERERQREDITPDKDYTRSRERERHRLDSGENRETPTKEPTPPRPKVRTDSPSRFMQ